MRPETTHRVPTEKRTDSRERWQVDPSRSTLTFTLRHIVVQEIQGRFQRWGGELLLHRGQPSLSELEAWVDLGSIDTDSAERDDQVRSDEFFDVGRFPRARFKSTRIESSDEQIRIAGILELHGVSHPVDLEITLGPVVEDGDVARASYEARGTIDRQDFGLHWNQDLDVGGVVVGDRVELRAHIEAIRLPDAGQ
jgi:polyisoprenoid-binding protein YceI